MIDENEPENRGFYVDAISILGFDGSFYHAFFIRSLVSRNSTLTFKAGWGIVAKSATNDRK